MIGTFGDIIFSTSSNKTLTYDEMETVKAPNWATADVISQKPHAQFLGPGQDTVSFKMFLHDWLGINIESELKKLTDASEDGKVAPLILGGKPYGAKKAKWYISTLNITEKVRDKNGILIFVETEVELKEYH